MGVKVVKKGDPIPEGFQKPTDNIRYCQSLMRARKGESFLIPAKKHACLVGASVLGLVPTPPKVVTGRFHHDLGRFASEEAAGKMISERPHFDEGSTVATVVAPLKDFTTDPDVVILIDLPGILYWLIAASTFFEGGRVTFSAAPFQATCADSTVIPILTGELNISLGCYGCRQQTDMEEDEIIAGIPIKKLEKVVEALEKMYIRPMQKAWKS